jgi:rhodanese-related sulfurtransferase
MSSRTDVIGAKRLLADGAQLVDVLPASIFEQEHLPGAMNVPLETLTTDTVLDLDRGAALVLYCFDQH